MNLLWKSSLLWLLSFVSSILLVASFWSKGHIRFFNQMFDVVFIIINIFFSQKHLTWSHGWFLIWLVSHVWASVFWEIQLCWLLSVWRSIGGSVFIHYTWIFMSKFSKGSSIHRPHSRKSNQPSAIILWDLLLIER